MNNEQLTAMVKTLSEQNEVLKKQVEGLNREVNRKTYIATGLSALIIMTNDHELVHKAAAIAEEACNI